MELGGVKQVITCLLIEDEPLAVEMMLDYIGRREDLLLLGIANELSEVKSFLERHDPSIIFLDLVIPPGVSLGFNFGDLPTSAIVIVVSATPVEHFKGVLPHGDIFELLKPVSFENFNSCIDRVLAYLESSKYGSRL